MPFQVLIVSNDKFRQYKIPQILAGWDWRLEPTTKGTAVYIPRFESCVENLLSILNLTESSKKLIILVSIFSCLFNCCNLLPIQEIVYKPR